MGPSSSRRRGQSMVEFALTVGLLMLLVIATAHVAIFLHYRSSLDLADSNGGKRTPDAPTRVRVLPRNGSSGLVVFADVAEQLAGQVGGGGEDAAGNDLALDLVQPELDLIQPA